MQLPTHLPPMRPKFAFDFPIDQDQAIELLVGIMDNDDHPIQGRTAGNHLMLVIPTKDRHFWSPWLNLIAVTNDPDTPQAAPQTHITGRFSPNPSVWTGFMMVYSSLAVLAFLATMFAAAQLIMNNPPWALYFLIPIILIAAAMYWASLIGQKLAHDQMQLLYRVTLQTLAQGSGLDSLSHPDPETETETETPA
ncbi:MAG: hypothetical protein JKY43_00190 [Phycisphaerales bacterium]|nr:hypothetical protein [Phycisphaerales bacterium]